tara:strand:- start:442 stop:1014 length:573 start_codon:yes stop_codon:yes gene_type:complete
MLQMRARGFAARDAFPDALSGVIIKEEAQDYPTGEPEMKDITPRPDDNPMDSAFGKGAKQIDPPGSSDNDDAAIPDTKGPENTDASEEGAEAVLEDDEARAWEMAVEEEIKEYMSADEWIAAMKQVWENIEVDKSMSFEDRRHEIAEHKKDHDDTIDRLKEEHPEKASAFGTEYKKIIRRLSAKAKEAQK